VKRLSSVIAASSMTFVSPAN